MDIVLSDSASLIAAILIAIVRLTRSKRASEPAIWYHLWQIRGFLFRSINAALDDPLRALSEPIMVAVALSSAYEAEHDPSTVQYRTQMDGLMRMITLRGGLSKIGEEDPWSELFYLWHITNTTSRTGCPQIYDAVRRTSRLVEGPRADADTWLLVNWRQEMVQAG